MKRIVSLTAVAAFLGTAAVGATELNDPSPIWVGALPATPHQAIVVRGAHPKLHQNLATPAAQEAAEPAEKRVSQTLFGDFPATVHQASLGLKRSPSQSQ